jgi:hypothetical protein
MFMPFKRGISLDNYSILLKKMGMIMCFSLFQI